MLLASRTLLGLKSKRNKERPKRLQVFDCSVKPNRAVMIPFADYPSSILMQKLGPPELFAESKSPTHYAAEPWLH
jgi:hypothetical protein